VCRGLSILCFNSAIGQTVADVETEYGKPTPAYSVSEHIWMTPEYAFDGQVCRMRLYPKRISADTNYLSQKLPFEELREVLNELVPNAIPYIPFKSNSQIQTGYGPKSELWTRMFHFYNLHREEFLQHYHKRSNVETTFSMIKAKFGQRLRCKSLTAQINEALCKVLSRNLCVLIQSVHELGIDASFNDEATWQYSRIGRDR
jgi:hypothetical protein